MKILVVDDDSLAAAMTSAILENAGHEILVSENGIDALEKMSVDSDIAAVVSDLNMPFLSGLELFSDLRLQGNKVPFILLTGDDPAQSLKVAPQLDACLTKDFSLEEVLPALIVRLCGK